MDKKKIKYIYNFYKNFYNSLWEIVKPIVLVGLIVLYGSIGLMFLLFDVAEGSKTNIDVKMVGWFFIIPAIIFMSHLLSIIRSRESKNG